jgi:hypothetical protein
MSLQQCLAGFRACVLGSLQGESVSLQAFCTRSSQCRQDLLVDQAWRGADCRRAPKTSSPKTIVETCMAAWEGLLH